MHFLCCQLHVKSCNSETIKCNRYKRQDAVRHGFPKLLWSCLFPTTCLQLQRMPGPCLSWVNTEGDDISMKERQCLTPSAVSCLLKFVVGSDVVSPLLMLVFLATSPHPVVVWVLSESQLININLGVFQRYLSLIENFSLLILIVLIIQ